ncbi:MAG: hypothetical protein ACXQT4_00335 [Methanotrichaceae archaeon]
MRGGGVGRKVRIFFSDGTDKDYASKKDGILIDLNEGFIHFIDVISGKEQIIPLSRVFRIVFMEGNDEDRMA